MVMLHGFLSSNLQWDLNRASLGERFDLALVELWGHGASPTPEDAAHWSVEGYSRELERIREELGAERWVVCGQSFGAGIAIRYALEHPDRVRGLVITNSRSALNDAAAEGARAGGPEAWEQVEPRSLPYHPCHARRFPEELKGRMEAAADRVSPRALWASISGTGPGVGCRDRASELSVPTLLVNGRFEKAFQGDRDHAGATIPGIEIVDLDGGHSVNVEAPDAFDRAVLDFEARLD